MDRNEVWKSPRKLEEERRQKLHEEFEILYQLVEEGMITFEEAKEAFEAPRDELFTFKEFDGTIQEAKG